MPVRCKTIVASLRSIILCIYISIVVQLVLIINCEDSSVIGKVVMVTVALNSVELMGNWSQLEVVAQMSMKRVWPHCQTICSQRWLCANGLQSTYDTQIYQTLVFVGSE